MRIARLGDWWYASVAGHDFLWAPNGVEVEEDECTCDPDGPEQETYLFSGDALRVVIEEAVHQGRNGGDPEEVGHDMVRDLELRGTGL